MSKKNQNTICTVYIKYNIIIINIIEDKLYTATGNARLAQLKALFRVAKNENPK